MTFIVGFILYDCGCLFQLHQMYQTKNNGKTKTTIVQEISTVVSGDGDDDVDDETSGSSNVPSPSSTVAVASGQSQAFSTVVLEKTCFPA